jgi:hypothetical protein
MKIEEIDRVVTSLSDRRKFLKRVDATGLGVAAAGMIGSSFMDKSYASTAITDRDQVITPTPAITNPDCAPVPSRALKPAVAQATFLTQYLEVQSRHPAVRSSSPARAGIELATYPSPSSDEPLQCFRRPQVDPR